MAKRFSAEYQALMRSWEWKFLRAMVFNRDGYKCKNCGIHLPSQTKERWLECDHKRYPIKGAPLTAFLAQPLSDYQTLCNICHKAKTKQERKQRRNSK